ncbi:hypothetical protein RIVM261_042760 [Rivularia sp. IAM M-261]|nr:hypothetical protein CAL7716_083070 [Calothrix sp. PCC 7716]GJD19320.1 hypothetical protein RIVM261_042760 [Rivularia sp. IAM M-261]
MALGLKSEKPTTKSSNNLSLASAAALTKEMKLIFSDIKDPA